MTRRAKAFIAAACLAMAAGCATPVMFSKDAYRFSGSESVAVVSLLGDQFHGIHVGTVVLSNTSYQADVSGWEIDALVERLAIATLRDKYSLKASALKVDEADRRRFREMRGPLGDSDFDAIYKLALAQGFDVVVIVNPTRNPNASFHRPAYGFFERSFLGSSHRCVYSLFTIEFRKAALKNQLGWASEFPCQSGERELVWRERFDDYSQAEKAALRSRVEKSFDRAIPAVLAEAYKKVQLENAESSK